MLPGKYFWKKQKSGSWNLENQKAGSSLKGGPGKYPSTSKEMHGEIWERVGLAFWWGKGNL